MNIDPKSETPDLQKCKDAVAKKHGEESWSAMEAMYFDNNGICTINAALYWEVAELYAATLQSENQRLQKINEELVKSVQLLENFIRLFSVDYFKDKSTEIQTLISLLDGFKSALEPTKPLNP